MRYPAFVEEIAREDLRPKILAGVFTGYATALLLFAITFAASTLGALSDAGWAYALIAIKLLTNSAAWWAWRTRRLYVELSALNILADVLLMTGAIYFTGGPLSPLVPIYFVEITVMALLTNAGLTITTVIGTLVIYASMVLAIQLGALPQLPSPTGASERLDWPMAIIDLIFVAAVMLGPGAYLSLMVDRLRRSERMLEARAKELIAAGRAKSEFTTNITHELRTPLHGILGVTEVMDEGVYGPVTEEQREAIRGVRSSATSLLELIDSLLVIARAEALRLEVRASPIDVSEVITRVAETGRMLVSGKRLAIDVRLADALPSVRTDRQKLTQILVNLLANAIKFTPDEGSVVIEAQPDEGGVSIAVRDTGIGIPRAMQERIFEPYVQVDGSARRAHGGAGLGLSVVRTLAELLAIDVKVESEEGRGSTFTVRVPADLPS